MGAYFKLQPVKQHARATLAQVHQKVSKKPTALIDLMANPIKVEAQLNLDASDKNSVQGRKIVSPVNLHTSSS